MNAPEIDIYTDRMCSYCAQAKRLLKAKQVEFNEIDVSADAKAREMMRTRANGLRTVPQIFINNLHIGGFDALSALDRKGLLDKLLTGQTDPLS